MNFIDDLKSTPVLIATGTGGVGKTTMSCALAIALAHRHDARVLVITIDPAKRLASVLCEENLGHVPQLINHDRFMTEGKARGEVFAAMVDTSLGWKDIVERYAKSDKDAQRIFNNKLYSNVTTRFSHSHDFVAMDQLYEHYHSGKFDYIVLDTPPTSQAFGFFDAPQAMSEFFGGRLVRLVTSPYRLGRGRAAKLFDLASQPFFALADKVLGKEFLNDIGEFFFLFHTMYDDFVERATDITGFLTSSRVHAALVVNPAQYLSRTYLPMCEGLGERKIHLDYLVVNNVPYTSAQRDEVEGYINDRSNESHPEHPVIADFIRRDWEVSAAIHDEMKRRKPASFEEGIPGQLLPVIPAPRVFTLDEQERIAELVANVQNIGAFDDTI